MLLSLPRAQVRGQCVAEGGGRASEGAHWVRHLRVVEKQSVLERYRRNPASLKHVGTGSFGVVGLWLPAPRPWGQCNLQGISPMSALSEGSAHGSHNTSLNQKTSAKGIDPPLAPARNKDSTSHTRGSTAPLHLCVGKNLSLRPSLHGRSGSANSSPTDLMFPLPRYHHGGGNRPRPYSTVVLGEVGVFSAIALGFGFEN